MKHQFMLEPPLTGEQDLANRLRAALAHGHRNNVRLEPHEQRDPRLSSNAVLSAAAVLVAITDRPEPGLILTKRSMHLRQHPGQIAFPGGRVDKTDESIVAAALREAREEIGLPEESAQIIGVSDRYHTFTGFDIVPVVAVVPPDLPLVAQPDEVEDWFEIPLSIALDPARRIRQQIEHEGTIHRYYEIEWERRRIWGVTAAILANLSRRLGHDAPA